MFILSNIVSRKDNVVKVVGVLTLGYLIYRGAVRFARNDVTVYITELVHLPPFVNSVQFANTALSIEGKVEVETRLTARCQFDLKLAALLRDKSLSSPNSEVAGNSNFTTNTSSNIRSNTEREYNAVNEINEMFATFTPVRRNRVYSAWSSLFYDKNSSSVESSEGSDWMSSLQHTFGIVNNTSNDNNNSNNNNNNNSKQKKKMSKKRYSSNRTRQDESANAHNQEELSVVSKPMYKSKNTLPLLEINSLHIMIDRSALWLHENKNTHISFAPACVMSAMLLKYNCTSYTCKSLLESLNSKPYINVDSIANQLPLQVTNCYVERDSSCGVSRCFRVSFALLVHPNFHLHNLKVILTLPSKKCKVKHVNTSGVGEFVHPVGNHTEICAWDVGSITENKWKHLLSSSETITAAASSSSAAADGNSSAFSLTNLLPGLLERKQLQQSGSESNNIEHTSIFNSNVESLTRTSDTWHTRASVNNYNSNENVSNDSEIHANVNTLRNVNDNSQSSRRAIEINESEVRAFSSDLWAIQFSLVYEMPETVTMPLSPSEMPWNYNTMNINENNLSEESEQSDDSDSNSSNNNSNNSSYTSASNSSRSRNYRIGTENQPNSNNYYRKKDNNKSDAKEMTWQTPMSLERDNESSSNNINIENSSNNNNNNNNNNDDNDDVSTKRTGGNYSNINKINFAPESTQTTEFVKDHHNYSRQQQKQHHHNRYRKSGSNSNRNSKHKHTNDKNARKSNSSPFHGYDSNEIAQKEIYCGLSNKARKRASRALRKRQQQERLVNIASGFHSSLSQEKNMMPKIELTYRLSSLASGAIVRKLQIVEQEDNWFPRSVLDRIAIQRIISKVTNSQERKVNRFAHYSTWIVQPVVVQALESETTVYNFFKKLSRKK